MTSLKFATIAAATLALAGTAFAQDAPPADPNAAPPPAGAPAPAAGTTMTGPEKKMLVGADLTGILPLGDYSKSASFAIGALVRFEYAVNDKISATARVGYLYNLGTPSGLSLSMIPILVGGTYKITPSGLFADAEIGVTNIRASVDTGGVSGSDSSTKFSFGVGVGYQKEKIKARLGFFMPGSEDNGTTSTTLYGIMASVGYDFVAF